MNIGPVIAGYRHDSRVGQREMAKTIGIDHSILGRIERGGICDARSLAKILAWLLNDDETYVPPPVLSIKAKRELSNAASIARLESR